MITSMSSIDSKTFRLLAFVIDELDKAQVVPPFGPLRKVFKFFDLPAMLTVTSPTNCESFIQFA